MIKKQKTYPFTIWQLAGYMNMYNINYFIHYPSYMNQIKGDENESLKCPWGKFIADKAKRKYKVT